MSGICCLHWAIPLTDNQSLQEAQLQQLGEELAQNRSDLRLAFKRITDLQAALEEEIDSEKDDSSPSR